MRLKGDGKKIYFWERIAFRISAGFTLPILVSAYALYSVSGVFTEVNEAKETHQRLWNSVRLYEGKALLTLTKVRLHALASTSDGAQDYSRLIEGEMKEFRYDIDQLRKNAEQIATVSNTPLELQLTKFFSQLGEMHRALGQLTLKLADAQRRQSPAEAIQARREIDRIVQESESTIAKLHAQSDLFEQKVSAKLADEEIRTSRTLGFYLLAVFFIGIAAAMFVTTSITSPVRQVVFRIRDIATGNGDLTKRVHTRAGGEMSELATWLNVFLDKTAGIIGTISNASGVVRKTTDEVGEHTSRMTVAAAAINHSMMEQSMNLDECTMRVGSIDDLIQNSGESTRQAASLSKIAMDRALQGGASVHETVEAMEKIEESSRKVEELVSSINEIASQTNLLAINAAIEATKAGEHGKGFAVVAEEVRKLAERARKLTAEVTALIGESSGRVKAGVGLARNAGVSLDGIIKDVEAVASLIQRIAAASAKQTESSTVVLEFMQKVSESVRVNLADMERVTHATEFTSNEVRKLDALVSQLNEIVGQFSITDSRASVASRTTPAPAPASVESAAMSPDPQATPPMGVPVAMPLEGFGQAIARPAGIPGLPSLPPGASPVDPSDEGGHEDAA